MRSGAAGGIVATMKVRAPDRYEIELAFLALLSAPALAGCLTTFLGWARTIAGAIW